MTAAVRLGALLLAVTVTAFGCRGRGPVAATVNDEEIPLSAVDRELADIAGNKAFVEARSREGVTFLGTRPGTFDALAVAQVLNRRITALLVRQELARRSLRVGAADLDAGRDELRRQLVEPATGASLLDGFPPRYVEEQARVQAESDLLQAAEGGVRLDDVGLRAAYEESRDRYRVWCVRWALYGTGADAAARAAAGAAAVAAGQDFAELAQRDSVDADSAGRGGALGCQTRQGLARLGEAFRDAAVGLVPGQVSAPVTGELGTFLVQATGVRVLPFEEVRAPVRAQLLERGAEPYEQLLRRLRGDAAVTVSSRFGTWDRTNPDAVTLVPPGGRPTTTTAPATTATTVSVP